MTQKILIAFDDSKNAFRAVEFVAKSFSPQNDITLLNIMLDTAALCKMNSPELTPLFRSQQSSFCSLEDKKRELVNEAMQKAKNLLNSAGFEDQNVHLKIVNKAFGVARDILAEAQNGYDVIVLGRRGLSAVKEFFLGSTSHKVFTGAKNISVLIIN
ncbi:MAG: universal stress protein [Desulfobacteraceae bacterium]|nr:universal stress protein [Desulfobacteraceae bacterium]